MSPMRSGCVAPRRTAAACRSMSSMVDREGALVAEHHHRQRVADEDRVEPGLLGRQRARVVVGGDDGDRLTAPALLGKRLDGHLAPLGARRGRGCAAHLGSFRHRTQTKRLPADGRKAACGGCAVARAPKEPARLGRIGDPSGIREIHGRARWCLTRPRRGRGAPGSRAMRSPWHDRPPGANRRAKSASGCGATIPTDPASPWPA